MRHKPKGQWLSDFILRHKLKGHWLSHVVWRYKAKGLLLSQFLLKHEPKGQWLFYLILRHQLSVSGYRVSSWVVNWRVSGYPVSCLSPSVELAICLSMVQKHSVGYRPSKASLPCVRLRSRTRKPQTHAFAFTLNGGFPTLQFYLLALLGG